MKNQLRERGYNVTDNISQLMSANKTILYYCHLSKKGYLKACPAVSLLLKAAAVSSAQTRRLSGLTL